MYSIQNYLISTQRWNHVITSNKLSDCRCVAAEMSNLKYNKGCRVVNQKDGLVIFMYVNGFEVSFNSEDWMTA
jgi:hypothetical protein